ncbi:MAG: alpha/beta fold hydrolase [Candidatus Dormibacteria bacterium]
MSALHIHDTGAGPPVLLLHAYPLDASMWDAQVAELSGRYRCLRPDFWGCGLSPPPPGPVTTDSYVGDVLAALAERGVDRVAVVGLSMGGYQAFALWRAVPSRVGALVLSNTRAAADTAEARAGREAQMDAVRSTGVEAIVETMTSRLLCARCHQEAHIADPVRGRIRRCTDAGVLAALEAIRDRDDSRTTLPAITAPALVVAGTADVIVPLDESRAMAAAISGATLEEFEGSAHLANLEQPHRYTRVLGDFLDSLPAW